MSSRRRPYKRYGKTALPQPGDEQSAWPRQREAGSAQRQSYLEFGRTPPGFFLARELSGGLPSLVAVKVTERLWEIGDIVLWEAAK